MTAEALAPGSALAMSAPSTTKAAKSKGSRLAYFPEWREHRQTAVYDRDALAAGDTFDGPAIIEEASSTLIVAPGTTFTVAASGNIVVALGGD